MRYLKVWQGLAIILLLVLMAAVFTAAQPGADSLRSRQMQLPNGKTVEVKPGQSDGPAITGPIISDPVYPAVRNIDVRELPQIGPTVKDRLLPEHEMPRSEAAERAGNTGPVDDPVAQKSSGSAAMPAPLSSFAGLDQQNWGAGWPPDTNGDVGPVYYIQTVNTSIGIYTKTTGLRAAAFTFDTFFNGTGTPCDANNNGDPIVLYDPQADRWIITDFAWSNLQSGPYYECIAVSQTNNPVTGGWYQYGFMANSAYLADYPKLGVWPDAYYMSMNLFDCLDSSCNSATWQGAQVYAFDRAALLAGQALTSVSFNLSAGSNYGALLPSNLRGAQPPAGSPNYFVSADENWSGTDDVLHLWKFHVDWTTPVSSTFAGPTDLVAAPFVMPAGSVPQLSGESLDTLGDRLMMQLQYRNIGSTESLWVNHTVSTGGVTGVRWYELRTPNTTPVIYQQGTYQPDTTYRWMGSLAVDRQGNMAVGYSTSSSSMYPAIRYAGRLAGDPLGQLTQGENTLIAGTGSQSGGFNRWGDYSAMTVDPVDDCTFWYTTEYYTTTGNNWQTRIGSFKFAECASGSTGTLSGTVRNAGNNNPIAAASISAQNSLGGTYNTTTNGSGVYQIVSLPIGTYTVTASAGGYNPGTAAGVAVTVGITTTRNFTLTALPQADLSVIKTASTATTAPSSPLGYTLTVTNYGPDAVLSTITVTDVLPAGYVLSTAAGAGWTCGGTTTVVCTRSGLGVSASSNINLTGLAPNVLGLVANTAMVTAGTYDSSPANNTSTVNVTLTPQTDLAIAKTGPAVAASGATLVYTINVSNNGSVAVGPFTATYTNPAAIAIPDNVAQMVTSTIAVTGLPPVQVARAGLLGFTHTWPEDIDTLLVAPGGQNTILMSDPRGGANTSNNINLLFDDTAPAILCTTGVLTGGTYHPTDCPNDNGTDVFPSPAPASPYTATLSVFHAANPNGTWKLFARDDATPDSGGFNTGWTLTLVGTYSLTVTDTLPVGTTFVGATGAGWSCAHLSGIVTCTRSDLAPGAAPSIAITVTAPATTGLITNTVVIGSNMNDTVLANNTAQFTTNLTNGGSTYGVNVTPGAASQSALPGTVVTYTLAVTNTGNASDTFTVQVSGNAFGTTSPLNVGPLGAGATTTFNVVVTIPPATPSGTLDTANVKVTSQSDPSKFANSTLTTTVAYGLYLPIVLREP